MKIEIPEFKEFPDSNISGRMIVNPYWLEYLLNLFFQGYLGEVWEEIMDTEMNHRASIENWGYGIIEQEFNKKHLSEEQLSPPVRTSDKSDSAKAEGFNMGLEVSASPTPKSPTATSLNPPIFQNGNFTLTGFPSENSRSKKCSLFGLTSQKGETAK